MGKKRNESRDERVDDDADHDAWLRDDESWRSVSVNTNALMLGAQEEGFMSLEVLDPSAASDYAKTNASNGDAKGTTKKGETKAKASMKSDGDRAKAKAGKKKASKKSNENSTTTAVPSALAALDEAALEGLSGKEARIMKRKLRWKAKIEAKKIAKKSGAVAVPAAKKNSGDGVAIVDDAPTTSGATQAKKKKDTKVTEKKENRKTLVKPDEELVADAALDVEEDWEKITHKKVAAKDAPMNKASTASGFDYNKHPTSGMSAVVDGVDLDRGCDVSAWFEFDLHPLIMRAIQDCGFTTPTPIQRECLLPGDKGSMRYHRCGANGEWENFSVCVAYFATLTFPRYRFTRRIRDERGRRFRAIARRASSTHRRAHARISAPSLRHDARSRGVHEN